MHRNGIANLSDLHNAVDIGSHSRSAICSWLGRDKPKLSHMLKK